MACTSDIIDERLIKKLEELGFNSQFEAPIKDEQIKAEIVPLLFERAKRLNQKNNILKIIKESVEIFSDHSVDSQLSSVQRQISIYDIFSQ